MPIRRADDRAYILASNISGNGSPVAIPGGEYMFLADGTAGGSTTSLQFQSPNGTWADVQVFTNSVVKFTNLPGTQTGIDLPAGNVRMSNTGGGSGLFSYLLGLG